MSERSVAVRLRANVTDFKREIGSAGASLDTLAQRAGGAEKVAQTSLGRLAQSARLQREEWTTVGTALTAFGAGVGAVGVAALKTGISYNTLQQRSRAALKTLTGSAEEANAQMDRLDAFARTSPFAKDVFIRAQQQMLGFGIEAAKVVPYLSAINDAVAATGGSNQDISELTRIFSQVQASAKITAVDLMQFGQRGVDAATLIGSQMGKTGAEIRGEITSGTLDAGVALDALAAGMSQRFEGASANVKTTFAGAFDRVKAAWRDLSSELAAPLVGVESGGIAVSGLNALADTMRSFQDAPGWIKGGVAALGGLTSAVALTAGAVALGLPRYIEFKDSLAALAATSPRAAAGITRFRSALGPLAIAITAAATASTLYAQAQSNARAMAEALSDTLDAETGAVTRNTSAWVQSELTKDQSFGINNTQSMAEAADELGVSLDTLTRAYLGQPEAIQSAKAAAEEYLAQQNLWNDTSLASSSLAQRFIRNLDDQSARLEVAGEIARTKTAIDEEAAATQGELGGAYAETTGEMEEQVVTVEALMDAQRRAMGVVLGALEAESAFQAAVDAASAAVAENGQTLDLNTEAGRANQAAINAVAEAGWDNVEAMLAQDPSGRTARRAMDSAREGFINAATAAGMGADEARTLANRLGLIPSNVTTLIQANATQAIREAEAVARAIGRIPTYKMFTMDGSVTSSFQAAQRAANNSKFSSLRRAGGGPVYGPGTTTSDSIPAWLSNREWVIQARSSDYYGDTVMRAMNEKRIPKQFFTALGLAGGGRPHQTYQPVAQVAVSPSVVGSPRAGGPVRLHPADIDAIGQVVLAGATRVSSGVLAGELAGVNRSKRARGVS